MKTYLLIVISTSLLCSCYYHRKVDVLKPEGEKATLTLHNRTVPQVEILALSDSRLYVTDGKKISTAHLADLRNLHIHGYRVDPHLRVISAIPPLLIEGIVMGVAFDVDQPVWGVVSGLTMVGTIYGFAIGDPKVNFSFPLEKAELEKLRPYCRYPQGLSNEQWLQLLQYYKQANFVLLTAR